HGFTCIQYDHRTNRIAAVTDTLYGILAFHWIVSAALDHQADIHFVQVYQRLFFAVEGPEIDLDERIQNGVDIINFQPITAGSRYIGKCRGCKQQDLEQYARYEDKFRQLEFFEQLL